MKIDDFANMHVVCLIGGSLFFISFRGLKISIAHLEREKYQYECQKLTIFGPKTAQKRYAFVISRRGY